MFSQHQDTLSGLYPIDPRPLGLSSLPRGLRIPISKTTDSKHMNGCDMRYMPLNGQPVAEENPAALRSARQRIGYGVI